MTTSEFTSLLTLQSVRADALTGLFDLAFDPAVDFSILNGAMSHRDDDIIPDGTSVKSYIRNYFLGARAPLNGPVDDSEPDSVTAIEGFDLLYRANLLAERESWTLKNIAKLINNPRVFAVSARLGHRQVTDCFLEMHAREWFGPLKDMVEAYKNSPLDSGPYEVSEELSAKRVGRNFFLHQGTNAWNRAWLSTTQWSETWDSHTLGWKSQIKASVTLANALKVKSYQFLFVPEKDTLARVADPGLFQSGFMPMLSIIDLVESAPANTVLFPVKDLISNVSSQTRLSIPDSHLCAEDYWIMFYRVMERFGLASHLDVDVRCEIVDFYSDLGNKFNLEKTLKQTIEFDIPDAKLTYGHSELQVPLRSNHVVFTNDAAPIRKSLLILGDSHSSVGLNPMLTYIARHFFESVEFSWSPFNVHGYKKNYFKRSQYDYLLCETSQRFATPTVS